MMLEVHFQNLINWTNMERVKGNPLEQVTFIIVDDGSPDGIMAMDIYDRLSFPLKNILRQHLRIYRIKEDIPWNQHGARNLGAKEAPEGWLLMQDMDRIFLKKDMMILLSSLTDTKCWYKPRSISMKAPLPTSCKPIVNTYACTKEQYWHVGGYDEDYCGVYGGDGPFLKAMEKAFKLTWLENVICFRYDRFIVGDSTTAMDRDRSGYRQRGEDKRKRGDLKPHDPIRFEWERVL